MHTPFYVEFLLGRFWFWTYYIITHTLDRCSVVWARVLQAEKRYSYRIAIITRSEDNADDDSLLEITQSVCINKKYC